MSLEFFDYSLVYDINVTLTLSEAITYCAHHGGFLPTFDSVSNAANFIQKCKFICFSFIIFNYGLLVKEEKIYCLKYETIKKYSPIPYRPVAGNFRIDISVNYSRTCVDYFDFWVGMVYSNNQWLNVYTNKAILAPPWSQERVVRGKLAKLVIFPKI